MPASLVPSALVLALALGAGCGDDEPAPEPVIVVAPADGAVAVRAGLETAHRAWSAGDRAGASAKVRATYAESFEPIEAALRAQDPENTLRLEYAFGSLAETLAAKGDAVAVADQVKALIDAVEAAVGALPVEIDQPAEAAPVAPMTTKEVTPPKPRETP